ncbi:hypothetical protein F5890DRAFT_536769 [Lentinula detonsa]|uniref:Secreted protein n=1 Tax=Lentinula detonsa TaxID=2804962 RepID=A0AA38PT96_9AGAR|nr:hypothetical protein F5890DRAFT_536769 [Lentinula detonsa]
MRKLALWVLDSLCLARLTQRMFTTTFNSETLLCYKISMTTIQRQNLPYIVTHKICDLDLQPQTLKSTLTCISSTSLWLPDSGRTYSSSLSCNCNPKKYPPTSCHVIKCVR